MLLIPCPPVGVEGSKVSIRLVVELFRLSSEAALTISVQVKLAPNSKHKRRKAQSVTCSMGANTTRPRSFQPPNCQCSFKTFLLDPRFARVRLWWKAKGLKAVQMQSHDWVQLCKFRNLLNGVLVCGRLSLKGKFAGRGRKEGTSDMANPEEWLTECQAKFGACQEAKRLECRTFKKEQHKTFNCHMHLQCKIYATGDSKQKCKHSSRANRATCSFFDCESESILYMLQPSFSSSKFSSIRFSLVSKVFKATCAKRLWNKGDPMICHLSRPVCRCAPPSNGPSDQTFHGAPSGSWKKFESSTGWSSLKFEIWSSSLLRNFYDMPSFQKLFRRFMLVCFNERASY